MPTNTAHGRNPILIAVAAGLGAIGMWSLSSEAAGAQQLWSVENVSVRPAAPDRLAASIALPSATSGPSGASAAALTGVASVQVEFDYLRLGMGYLELPLADGTVIEAENAVFEDRGGGNLMWTGEVPGAGYESVLFTVQDGHLVGWFGEPGGPKYTVHAGPDGRGTVAVERGPTGDWCGVEEAPSGAGSAARTVAPAADRPLAAASDSGNVTLDVLLLYTSRVEEYWREEAGSAEAGVRQLEDYLNMVFRNGEIPGRANLIAERWAPEALIHPPLYDRRDSAGLHEALTGESLGVADAWHWEFWRDAAVARLRERHAADVVFFLQVPGTAEAAGQAFLRGSAEPWSWSYGWGGPGGSVFAHEVGHILGGLHEPGVFTAGSENRIRPYAFGHTDLTSCAEREDWGDTLVCPHTVMSYGVEAQSLGHNSSREPFYSSVRHKPNGWTIGVAGTSEVERVLHETVPIAARDSEVARSEARYPRRIEADWSGRGGIRVTWAERWSADESWTVRLALVGGSNLVDGSNRVWDQDSRNVKPILEGGLVAGAEVNVGRLRPAAAYRISVIGPWGSVRPLASDTVVLRSRGAAPAAPVRVAAEAMGADGVRLTWRGGSPAAGSFQVACRGWQSRWARDDWRLCADRLPGGARVAELGGLKAEEEIQVTAGYWDFDQSAWREGEKASVGRYSFAVAAHNDRGYAASETVEYEVMPGPHPPPTAGGEVSNCEPRESGLGLDGHGIYMCFETPDGARRRAWDYGLESDRSGLLYFFGRDNAEVLVKVLDGCAVNGHRWIFVAPVTTLGFRLAIREPGDHDPDRRQWWYYDSKRRPQEELGGYINHWDYDDDGKWGVVRREWVGNPQGRTARTVSDTTAFPCRPAEVAAAKARAARATGGEAAFLRSRGAAPTGVASLRRLGSGSGTDCAPRGAALTLAGGYRVSMCYETYAGETGDAKDWGLDSTQSGLLYFFQRDNAEVLIKVLDGCGVNGHRWVFVAPVTDLAFNLHVESPDGQRWTHRNRLGQTADAASDVAAFPCVDGTG